EGRTQRVVAPGDELAALQRNVQRTVERALIGADVIAERQGRSRAADPLRRSPALCFRGRGALCSISRDRARGQVTRPLADQAIDDVEGKGRVYGVGVAVREQHDADPL